MRRAVALVALLAAAALAWWFLRPSAPIVAKDSKGDESRGAGAAPGDPDGSHEGRLAAPKPRRPAAAASDAPPERNSLDRSRGPFRGIVVDESGRPVAGALVRVLAADDEDRVSLGSPSPQTTSGADGAFQFVFEHERRDVPVRATGPEGTTASTLETLDFYDVKTVVLHRTRPIRVRVVDPRGLPLVGLLVRVGECDDEFSLGFDPDGDSLAEATTDTDGRAVLSMPDRRCYVVARLGEGPYVARFLHEVLPEGVDVLVVLPDTGSVVGRVVDADGSPVRAATVRAVTHDAPEALGEPSSVTDEAGEFRLVGVPSPTGVAFRTLHLKVEASGWPPIDQEVSAPAAGERRRIDVRLPSWRHARGVVVDVDGAPVAGAGLQVSGAWGKSLAKSDAGGAFSTDRLDPSAEWLVATATREGKVSRGAVSLAGGDPLRSLRIVLGVDPSRTRSVPDLRPAADVPPFAVRVLSRESTPIPSADIVVIRGAAYLKPLAAGQSDADGRTRLVGVPRETVRVVVRAVGRAAFWADVDARSAREATLTAPSGRISGTLVRADGSTAQEKIAIVLALSDDEDGDLVLPVSSVTPGPDGRFVVDGLSDGEYRLRLADRDRVLVGGARTYRPGADVRLITSTLTGAAKLVPVGEWIDDETGLPNPLQDGTLTIWPPDRERDRQRVHFSRFRDEPGHSVADGPVEPGVYRGTLEVQGYKPVAIDRLVVPDGERAPRIRVRLKEPKGRIEGSVRDAAGRRPPGEIGVRVMTTLSTATLRTATVGDDGSFAVAVPLERPFDAIVEIESARLRVAPRRIDLDANAFARVDFVVEPAGAIRVRAPAGRVPKFRVVATAQRLGADGRATGTDRTVELDAAWITAHGPERTLGGLEAGRYRLRVAWDGDGWPEQTVDVAVGATTDVDLRAP